MLLAVVLLAQTSLSTPPVRKGCAAFASEFETRLGGSLAPDGGARARDACYAELGHGFTTAEVGKAMLEFADRVLSAPSGGPLVEGDAWTVMLPARPERFVDDEPETSARRVFSHAHIENVSLGYWGSCDDRGPHGSCDQMGLAKFRLRNGYWAELRYFDLYSNNDTAGAAGLGLSHEADGLTISTGAWVGTYARGCVSQVCTGGAAFALPWFAARVGPPEFFVDVAAIDGPYVSSGQSRLELGHIFESGSMVEGGVTAGIFGNGLAARGDARLVLWHVLQLDGYASAAANGFALGGGVGFRY